MGLGFRDGRSDGDSEGTWNMGPCDCEGHGNARKVPLFQFLVTCTATFSLRLVLLGSKASGCRV